MLQIRIHCCCVELPRVYGGVDAGGPAGGPAHAPLCGQGVVQAGRTTNTRNQVEKYFFLLTAMLFSLQYSRRN